LSNVIVRKCERRDLDQVIAIEEASFPDPYSRAAFELLLLKTGQGFCVACKDGAVVGYVACGITFRGKAHLISIATRPEIRRCGIGMLLMKSVIDYLVEKKIADIVLEVRPSNQAAIRFYQKFSFVEVGRKLRYYSDGEDALIMQKHLDPT
jgi:ribosomal-protein-alanine N-acetyltransferase